MKRPRLLLFMLSVLCALLLSFTSAFGGAAMLPTQANLNSETFPAMTTMTVDQGGAVFTEIVLSSTDLLQKNGMATMRARSEDAVMVALKGSSIAPPIAYTKTIINDTVNVSSGGDSFHVGKYIPPNDTGMILALIEEPAYINKGGGSFHVGKFHKILDAKAFAAGHPARQTLIIT